MFPPKHMAPWGDIDSDLLVGGLLRNCGTGGGNTATVGEGTYGRCRYTRHQHLRSGDAEMELKG